MFPRLYAVSLPHEKGSGRGGIRLALACLREGRVLARQFATHEELMRLWAWEQLETEEIAIVTALAPNAASIRLHRPG